MKSKEITDALNAEIDEIARIVEEEDGWQPVYYRDTDHGSHSHVDLYDTLRAIGAAIRARRRDRDAAQETVG